MEKLKHPKGLVLISVFILISDVVFIWLNYHAALNTLDEETREWSDQIERAFYVSLNEKAGSMLQLATFVSNDPHVVHLLKQGQDALIKEGGGSGKEGAAKIRRKIYEHVYPSWLQIQKQFDVQMFCFHLEPDATSFLRVHMPDKHGDKFGPVRNMVVDANTYKKNIGGVETGRMGTVIRGMVPVFYTESSSEKPIHLGVVEAGTSFSMLVDALKTDFGCNAAVLLKRSHVEQVMWKDEREKRYPAEQQFKAFVIEAATDEHLMQVLKDGAVQELLQTTGSLFLIGDAPLQISVFQLRNYKGHMNGESAGSGNIIVWKDASKQWQTFKRTTLHNVVYAVLAFFLIEAALLLVWTFTRKRFQARLDQKTGELKEAEAELIRTEKLQSIIELAGAVCHEINQPLMVISGYAQLLLNTTPKDSAGYEHVKSIFEQAERIDALSDKLMNITEYKTRDYLRTRIFDIEKSSRKFNTR